MAYRVVYRQRYVNKIAKLILYLRQEWGNATAQDVAKTITDKIGQLTKNPYLGSLQGRKKIRSIIVAKHNRMYYRIEKEQLIIIDLIDMRIHPSRNPYK